MRLPSPTMAELGVAAALSSQVVVYLISESTCVTRRFALSCTESSYTVGLIWGRPRLRKPRLEPHSPASSRPARRCATESRVPERVTRLMPSLSWAMPRVAVRRPARKRFCSRVGGGGGAIDSAGGRAESSGGAGSCAPRAVAATHNSMARQRSTWPPLHLLRAPHGRPPRRSLRGHAPVRRARRARLHFRAARSRDRALPARDPRSGRGDLDARSPRARAAPHPSLVAGAVRRARGRHRLHADARRLVRHRERWRGLLTPPPRRPLHVLRSGS